jgi:hypothetical protein
MFSDNVCARAILHEMQPMSDWTPTVAAALALIYFLLFPDQFKALLVWLVRVVS